MKKKFTVAILGAGNRGILFAKLMQAMPEKYELRALCDMRRESLNKCRAILGVEDTMLFNSDETFFAEKRADVLVIATYDRDHVSQAIRGMKMGYDVLMEKPITDDAEELGRLVAAQKETGSKVMICYEMRYVGAFRRIQEWIDAGKIGDITLINAMERVAYLHFAQAYVRGPFRKTEIAHPLILAKCSHDLDLISHFIGKKCLAVTSFGSTQYFLPKSGPADRAERCLDCPHRYDCTFSTQILYLDRWHKEGEPIDGWPYDKVTQIYPVTEEALIEGLKTGQYGTCVYRGDNNVCDRQSVTMEFEGGTVASFTVSVAAEVGREMNLFGTEGEIVLNERDDLLALKRFGEEPILCSIADLAQNDSGHGGGDLNFVKAFYDFLSADADGSTTLDDAVASHRIGIAAEKSRLSDGCIVKL